MKLLTNSVSAIIGRYRGVFSEKNGWLTGSIFAGLSAAFMLYVVYRDSTSILRVSENISTTPSILGLLLSIFVFFIFFITSIFSFFWALPYMFKISADSEGIMSRNIFLRRYIKWENMTSIEVKKFLQYSIHGFDRQVERTKISSNRNSIVFFHDLDKYEDIKQLTLSRAAMSHVQIVYVDDRENYYRKR